MLVQTKYFGEIDLAEDKIIDFEYGIIGFENFKRFTILYDNEKESRPVISWLQSLDEKNLAIPIVNPFLVKDEYNPIIEDEILKPLGTITDDNIAILLTMTIPSDITKITVNLKAPIIINSDTKKGCQIIVENKDYLVKYNVYEVIKGLKEQKGDE